MSEETTVLYDLAGGVATITLNRPQAYNAFTAALHAELLAALKRAERDVAVRCIVLTGAGKGFCSGQDLREAAPAESIGDLVRERYNPLIMKLRSIPKPIVAAVNGVAAGAGMSLALACDLRVAVDSARFVAAFANVGLAPDSGMSYFLPRLIGAARAVELCMTGGTLDAATAYRYGMVNAVASSEEFPSAVRQLAERLANGPAVAIGLIKRSFELAAGATLEQALDYEAQAQQIAGMSAEHAEGVRAFIEKRPPRFRQAASSDMPD
ncbi:MAG TPA: enoyl-CoA hydratase-related protein [Roseiflexaceae bacterium]|nr:enoyl-CoA hydratase-related protein [Roseiflexaceae bacterium]